MAHGGDNLTGVIKATNKLQRIRVYPKLDRLVLGRVRGCFSRQLPDLVAEGCRKGIAWQSGIGALLAMCAR
jgi:hypothetical protein